MSLLFGQRWDSQCPQVISIRTKPSFVIDGMAAFLFLMPPNYSRVAAGVPTEQVRAGQGNLETVRLMIEVGMPLDRHGVNGDTPFHCAASMGHLPVVRLLVEAKAPVDAKQVQGMTPKQLAEDYRRNGWVTKPEMQEIIAYLEQAESER